MDLNAVNNKFALNLELLQNNIGNNGYDKVNSSMEANVSPNDSMHLNSPT